MTTALYRRYRPDTFAEVIGQEHVTEPLMQALRADRVTHAYLFSGPRGCGKTTSARILARCLNCAEGPTDTPCGRCESCVELARGGAGSLDVVEIDAASHGGVDDARDLRERATFAPTRDRFKIFILDEAHMVSSQGFNALLKIVEEPPPHIKFIFATTEPDKVIGTIRSRTHHYPFRLVPPDVLQPYLDQVCRSEGVEVGSGVLPLVVRAGGGSVRDSLSVLDQLVAGADESGLDYERAVALLGYTHAALLDDAVEAIAARDGASAFRVIDRVISSGHEPRRFVEDLLERLRDLIVIAASGEAARAVLRDLPADQLARMQAQAATLGPAELSRSADLVNDALTEMTGATSPRLHLELLAARLLLPAVDDGARGLGARVERLEREVAGGVSRPAPIQRVVPAAPVAPVPAPVPAAEPATSEAATAPVSEAAPAPGHTHAPEPATDPAAGDAPATSESAPTSPAVATAAPAAPPAPASGAERERAPRVEPEPEPAAQAPNEPAAQAPTEPAAQAPTESAPQAPTEPEPAPQAEPAPAPQPSRSGGMDAESVRRRWPEVLQTLRGLRMATWVLVSQNAQVGEVSVERLALAFTTPQLATTFRQGSHAEHVQRALHETLGLQVRVEPTLGAAATSEGGASERADTESAQGGGADGAPVAETDSRRPAREGAVAGVISTADAEASWDAPAPVRAPAPERGAARAPQRPSAPAGPAPQGRPGIDEGGRAGRPGQGDRTATRPGSPAQDGRSPGPRSDDIPVGPEPGPADEEPDPIPPPWDVPSARAGARPSPGGARPASPARAARPVAAATGSAAALSRSRIDDGEDADPDDPDLVASGLVGAPLVAQMLGGTVIDEIPED